jgi:hypothetical protein
MSRVSLASALSALWHTLSKIGDLHGVRSHLKDGTRYRVEGKFVGKVAGYEFDEPIECTLVVSEPTSAAASTSAPKAELVAHLLDAVPSTRRASLCDELAAYFAEHHELPELEKAKVESAKLWLKRLNASIVKKKEGAVSVELDPDQDDLAAAEEKTAA